MELFNGVTVVHPGDSFERWHQATCRNFSLTNPAGRPAEISMLVYHYETLDD